MVRLTFADLPAGMTLWVRRAARQAALSGTAVVRESHSGETGRGWPSFGASDGISDATCQGQPGLRADTS